jgi:molybdopterin-guanine dinucleotide biosynthesis protein A
LARSVTADVRIVGDRGKFAAFAPVVEDIFQTCGPLGGIHAALRASVTELNLMLAVDVPFISPALLKFLVARARESAALVTVARTGGKLQPLCAVYRREFAGTAESALRQGCYRIDALFDAATTLEITEEELRAAGFSVNAFRNLNTQQELEAAQESVSK